MALREGRDYGVEEGVKGVGCARGLAMVASSTSSWCSKAGYSDKRDPGPVTASVSMMPRSLPVPSLNSSVLPHGVPTAWTSSFRSGIRATPLTCSMEGALPLQKGGWGDHGGLLQGSPRTTRWLPLLVRGLCPRGKLLASPCPSSRGGSKPRLWDRFSPERRQAPGCFEVLTELVRCRDAHLPCSLSCGVGC